MGVNGKLKDAIDDMPSDVGDAAQSCDDSSEGTPAPSPPRSARRARASSAVRDHNEGIDEDVPSDSDEASQEQALSRQATQHPKKRGRKPGPRQGKGRLSRRGWPPTQESAAPSDSEGILDIPEFRSVVEERAELETVLSTAVSSALLHRANGLPPPLPQPAAAQALQPEASQTEKPEADVTGEAQLPGTQLPVSEAVLERPNNFPAIHIPSEAFGDAVASYNVLRAFSWQLRLSPFTLEDWCAALMSPHPTALADETHLSVMRLLAQDESKAMRAERQLDIELMDQVTWPDYVWEWLRYMADPLAVHHFSTKEPLPPPPRPSLPSMPDDTGLAVENGVGHRLTDDTRQALLEAHFPRRQLSPATTEYCQLAVAVKAAIAVRLTTDMLEVRSVRAEIDRREAHGHLVAGRHGVGGAYPMRSPAQRAQRQKAVASESLDEDDNLEHCVLCSLGGSLLCCDGCPAAYHVKCLGETTRSIPDGEWLCPECVLGGRGEAAGLRVPQLGRNVIGQSHVAAYNLLFHSALPAYFGDSGNTMEINCPVPMRALAGKQAAECVAGLRRSTRPRGFGDRPEPSSLPSLQPLPRPSSMVAAGAEHYMNRYRRGWDASVAVVKQYLDDMRRNKRAGGPSRSQLPAPLPLPRWMWPLSQIRGGGRSLKCGNCRPCRLPSLHKPCANPVGGHLPSSAVHQPWLAPVANQLLKMERDLFPLLDGKWMAADCAPHQQQWRAAVLGASDARQLAAAAVRLVSALRPTALPDDWNLLPGQPVPLPPGQLPPEIANYGFHPKPSAASAAVHVLRLQQQQQRQQQHAALLEKQSSIAAKGSSTLQYGQHRMLLNGEPAPPLLLSHASNNKPPLLSPTSNNSSLAPGVMTLNGRTASPQPVAKGLPGEPALGQLGAVAATPARSPPIMEGPPAAAAAAAAAVQMSDGPDIRAPTVAHQPPPSMSSAELPSDQPPPARAGNPSAITASGKTPLSKVTPKTETQLLPQEGCNGDKSDARPAPKTRSRSVGLAFASRTTRASIAQSVAKSKVNYAEMEANAPESDDDELVLAKAMSSAAATAAEEEAAAWDDSTVTLSRMADSRCVARRTPWQKAKAVGRPSAAAIRKGARQGGCKRLRGVKYSTAMAAVTPAAAWTAAAEAAVTVPQLARVLRALDSAIQWDAMRKRGGGPEQSWRGLGIGARRNASNGNGWEYRLQQPSYLSQSPVAAGSPLSRMQPLPQLPRGIAPPLALPPSQLPPASTPLRHSALAALPPPLSPSMLRGHALSSVSTASAAGTSSLPPLLPPATGRTFFTNLLRAEAPSLSQPTVTTSTAGHAVRAPSVNAATHPRNPTPPSNALPPLLLMPSATEGLAAGSVLTVPGASASLGPSDVPSALLSVAVAPRPEANDGALVKSADSSGLHHTAPSQAALDSLPSFGGSVSAAAKSLPSMLSLAVPDPGQTSVVALEAPTPHLPQLAEQSVADGSLHETLVQQSEITAQPSKDGSVTLEALSSRAVTPTLLPCKSQTSEPLQDNQQQSQACHVQDDILTADVRPPVASPLPHMFVTDTGVANAESHTSCNRELVPNKEPLAPGPIGKDISPSQQVADGAVKGEQTATMPSGAHDTSLQLPATLQTQAKAVQSAGRLEGLLTPLAPVASPTPSCVPLQPTYIAGFTLTAATGASMPAAARPQALQNAVTASPTTSTQTTEVLRALQQMNGRHNDYFALAQSLLPQTALQQQEQVNSWWVHERLLPLWFVRQFEDSLRKNQAQEVAKEAVAAALRAKAEARQAELAAHDARVQKRSADRRAAQEAAAAAAAKLANSCAVCGELYSSQTQEGVFWVACDACRRWHHNTCAAATQQEVDDLLDSGAKWECRPCATTTAARMRMRMEGGGRGGRGRGRGGRGGGGRGNGVHKGVWQIVAGEVTPTGKPKKVFMKNAGCPMCGTLPSEGQPLVKCRSCRMSFHCSCLDTRPPENNDGKPFTCPNCATKVSAKTMKHQERHEASLAADAVERERLAARTAAIATGRALRAQREDAAMASQAAKAKEDPSWRAVAGSVLEQLQELECATEFLEPVQLDFDLYYENIPEPMDLAYIGSTLAGGGYCSPHRLLSDVQLVWANCREFNDEGDYYWNLGEEARMEFQCLWAAAGLPHDFPLEQPPTRKKAAAVAAEDEANESHSGTPLSDEESDSEEEPERKHRRRGPRAPTAAAALEAKHAPPTTADRRRLKTAATVIQGVIDSQPEAQPFAEPVGTEVKGYAKIISRPMDLGTVVANIQNGVYSGLDEAVADIRLVWTNCQAFNEPGSPITHLCLDAEARLAAAFVAAGLLDPTREVPRGANTQSRTRKRKRPFGSVLEDEEVLQEEEEEVAGGTSSGAASPWRGLRAAAALSPPVELPTEMGRTQQPSSRRRKPQRPSASAAASPPQLTTASGGSQLTLDASLRKTEARAALEVVKKVVALPDGDLFAKPVREKDAKGYRKKVARPMDLATVAQGLQPPLRYATLGEVWADLELIWANCRLYNGIGSWVDDAAQKLQKDTGLMWSAAGLPHPTRSSGRKEQLLVRTSKRKANRDARSKDDVPVASTPQNTGTEVSTAQESRPANQELTAANNSRSGTGNKRKIRLKIRSSCAAHQKT